MVNNFDELVRLKGDAGYLWSEGDARVFFAPDMGARVFCELGGHSLHRLDLANVRDPNRKFNNFGGNNFWPAPEGGLFGFNYQGDTWRVQPALNNEPFRLTRKGDGSAEAVKETALTNRKEVKLSVVMERGFARAEPASVLMELAPEATFAYTVDDRIRLEAPVSVDEALLGCWTLEQFDASDDTVSFVQVSNTQEAINFDFYDDPSEKITYGSRGFLYKTDSRQRGQIGIKRKAGARFIGCCDFAARLLVIREILDRTGQTYFNIADNDQPRGPFSADDEYSIFNGDEELGFFELETIGGADVHRGMLTGSRLLSRTSFGLFNSVEPLKAFMSRIA